MNSASPLDFTTSSRHPSGSPSVQNKSSNLTSALSEARGDRDMDDGGMDVDRMNEDGLDIGNTGGRQSSFNLGNPGSVSQWGSGARPILMQQNSRQERPRRESIAGSMVGGMSWGGISVGSWIRDDFIMAGSSPFNPNPSSSQHSSSYLPKMEANFMRDFSCCGLKLSNFHNLLQHYEEEHAGAPQPPSSRGYSQSGQGGRQGNDPSSRAAIANNTAAAIQRSQNEQRRPQQQMAEGSSGANRTASSMGGHGINQQGQNQLGGFRRTPLPPVEDIDVADDMDMDDVATTEDDEVAPPALLASRKMQPQNGAQGQGGQRNDRSQSPAAPSLNLATANVQNQYHQGLRSSQPTTPSSGQYNSAFQNNPTVSSVNTPTLNTPHLQDQQQQRQGFGYSKPSSPKTPQEDETDVFSNVPIDVPMQTQGQYFGGNDGFGMGYGAGNGMLELCIDEPAKRLFSPNGMFNNQMQYGQFQPGTGEQYNDDRDFPQRLREQQMNAGVTGAGMGLVPGEEPKPFRCPVLGCEKAYKNQNGLKYHKSHGHNNQKLHENGDGTFSIVNPETHIPYPGTLGMEKEKPYRCDFCGKRYKNLNGLKYHRAHSAPCNPDLKMPPTTTGGGGPMDPATAGIGAGAGAGGAGAGLGGLPMSGLNLGAAPGAGGGGGLAPNEGMVS